MNEETYKALKRIMKWFGNEIPLNICGDIKQVEDWIEEVAKEYE
jgi:hypothetical protein